MAPSLSLTLSISLSLQWGEQRGCTREEMISFYDSEGNVPLHSAVHGGDIKAVELCLKSGAKISTQQHDLSTPVHLACAQVSPGSSHCGGQPGSYFVPVMCVCVCAIDGQETTRVVATFGFTLNWQILMQIRSRGERDILGGRQSPQTSCLGWLC